MLVMGAMAWPRAVSGDPTDLVLPAHASQSRFDFETAGIEGWTIVTGEWKVEEMEGATSGRKVLVQRATRNAFNVVIAPSQPYTDVDVSMKFKPIAGGEDVAAGIVFRFADGMYYLVRANALETNFRLYAHDRGRRQLASATVVPPSMLRWHTVRVVAVGDRVQAWLDGTRYLDHRDTRFKVGRVGLWTKADSLAAFDDLTIRGVPAG